MEKGASDSGVQTDVLPLPALAGINVMESSSERVRPSLIVGDRKRVVQEELLKHYALQRNENRIRRKRLHYQLERIARKRHLLEAKQELQRLETALSLGVDGPMSPELGSPSKRRGRPVVLRRHSFSVDLLSRLYPQHTPIFSQFLRRSRLSESTASLSRVTFPRKWVSDECLPGKPRGRSNTMPSRCSQGASSRTGSSENIKITVNENMPSEEMTGRDAPASQLHSSVWTHNIPVKTTVDSDKRDHKKELPIIKQSSIQKTSPKLGKSLPHDRDKGLETIRKALSQSVGVGIKMALSRVFRKPPLGSRVGKSTRSVSRAKTQFAVEGKKDKVVGDMGTKQQKDPSKSTASCDGLDQLISLKEKDQGRWHSVESLTKKTNRWVKSQQDLSNWVENNADEVANDSSDCDSLFSVDSLSSAYATALAEQLRQEDCEPSEVDSEDSQMSKDSLVKESSGSTDSRQAPKLTHSICHTLYSSSTTGREKLEESKEMPEELFWSLHGQNVTRQVIKDSSHFSQVTSDSQHSSEASVRETEAFLALTDAWSSTDAADSPRILGESETSLKLCILAETSSSQSQVSLDLSGESSGSECLISHHFDSTQGKDATVKERSHMYSERETVLDYFLDDLASTSGSTAECTLLQENNELLSNVEAPNTSGETSSTQNPRSNKALCTNKPPPPPPPELAPLETNDVDILVVSAPFEESAVLPSWSSSGFLPDKCPYKNIKSNSKKQTELIPSGDECILTKSFAPQNDFKESKHETQYEQSCIAETSSRKSNIFSKCGGQIHLEIQHFHGTLQPGNASESSNKQESICSGKELPQSAIHGLKIENEFQSEPQSIMKHLINHVAKELSDEKTSGKRHIQSTEKFSESYDTRKTKGDPFEMNVKSDSANRVADSLRHCDAQLEHESCNGHSRKRSKDSQDDLAGSLKTPKRSCVESLVPDLCSVNNVPFMLSDSPNIGRDSTGKLLPTEKVTASLSQTLHQDSKTTSMDDHINMHENSNNPVARYTSEDRTTSAVVKEEKVLTIGMNKSEMQDMPEVKFPDVEVVHKGVFESSTPRRNGLGINDKISEVVKEHLNMDCGKEMNDEPETNNKRSSATNTDALKNTQNKDEIIAEGSPGECGSSHAFPYMIENSVDIRENVDNTDDCLRGKNILKNPTEQEVMLDRKAVGLLGSCPSLLLKNSAEIEHSDNLNACGPMPQDMEIKLPEVNTVLYEIPTDNHPESLWTSHLNGHFDDVISESKKRIQLTLISTCKQGPGKIMASENVTAAGEHDQFLLMKTETETIPISKVDHNSTVKGISVRTEDNGFDQSSYTHQKPGVYSEDSISGVSKYVCDVTMPNQCSEAVVHHTKEAVKSVEANEGNMATEFQQVVELNTIVHLDAEPALTFQKKNERLFNSDKAENVQTTDSRPLKTLACKERAGENHSFTAQEQPDSGQNADTLNETKDKIMDLENHTCSGRRHKETTVSKSCEALRFCTSELQRDNQTQTIQRVVMSEKPSDCSQNDGQSLCKEDHMPGRKMQEQCVNVQKETKRSDHLPSQDLAIPSRSVQRPEQTDMKEENKLELKFSASRPLNPKEEDHQIKTESTEKDNEGKQHAAINSSRLVFSRTNEERQRVKPKRYRKAHFTAPVSSSTDSTPDSSLDEVDKSRGHKYGIATPTLPGTPAPGRPTIENRNGSIGESNACLSSEISPGSKESKSKHNESYGTGSDNPYPCIPEVTNDVAGKVRWKKYHITAKLIQIPGPSKDDEVIQLTRNNSHGNNGEKASIQNREPILHFGSSDINPFVHTRKKDQSLKYVYKTQPFGSAVDISSQLSSLESSSNGIARCCSMDNGLNVQNSPFSSHLSTYAVQKGLSSTLSSAEDSKEHISTEPKLREAFRTPPICNEKILTASGSDSCNNTLDLASSSGQVDEIVLVCSSEHGSQENKQDSRKCDHGTQTVKSSEDLEKKTRHRRSSTQVPASKQVHGTSTTWTSLQNMSEHLSELIVSTSDLLGNIQCMRTGESSVKNGPPLKSCSKVSKVCSDKYCKSDGSTQTAIDVGIQTEDIALLTRPNNVLKSSPAVQNPKSHEVNVIVKVIGSEVCNVPKQDGVVKSIKDQYDIRQTFETNQSMPDLRPGGSPPSEKLGGKLDTEKILSLETVAPNKHRFNPVTVDRKASNTFAVCAERKWTPQMIAKDNQTYQQIKPKNNPDKRVLLIDRASSPILTVDVSNLQKEKSKASTIHTPTEVLSKTVRNPPENQPVSNNKPKSHYQRDHFYTYQTENKSMSSVSLENLSNNSCISLGAPHAHAKEVSSGRYIQNGRKKHSHGVQSEGASQAIWGSPLPPSHSSSVRHRQPVDLSQSTVQSSTPINQRHTSGLQEYKHKLYKDVSCWSDLSKDTVQYQDEDSASLAPSDCNTDVLVSINPLNETIPLQEDCWIPENLPVHNKFTNWSGISHQPPARLTNKNNATVDKSPHINTHSLHLRSAESESLGYRYKPELLESADRRTREIERLRKEREQVLASMQSDLSPHPLSVELTEAKLHYGLGKTDTLLKLLKSSSRPECTISTKQQLYDRHRRSIDGLRKEREDRLQMSRRARSLSPSKHPNSSHLMTEQSQRAVDLPSRQREYLQQLRKEVVEMSRVPDPPRTEGQYPTDIELLLRDYSRAREEAKTEIAKARMRLRERTEQEKRRLEQQALSQSVKDHLRLCTRVSNSTLCTGSNLSLSSGPTSGYNSSNAALLKDGTPPSIQITGVSDRELRVRSRPPIIPPQNLKASRAWLSAQDIRVESSAFGFELHSSSSSPSSPPGRQRTSSFSSPSSISISYQDIADCTLASAISEVHLASGGDVRNLLAGSAEAGWRHHGLENGVQTFHRPSSSRPSAHGFLGAMELERPMANLWSLIRDHSKTHLYNKAVKSAWTRVLDDTTQLVYLLTDPSNCPMKQPRDFCCLSTESKRDDMWVLAMQSVFEESLPRPSVDTVRGEMFPSAWILQRSRRQGREIVTVIYLLQVDLGTPTLPQRLLNVVARKQAAVIADLNSFLSI